MTSLARVMASLARVMASLARVTTSILLIWSDFYNGLAKACRISVRGSLR